MGLPLDGIKVLDFSNLLPGPFSTMLLADLGAEVIKVERPEGGDTVRRNKRMFNSINRNKKSITANLKDADSIKAIKEYVKECDVLVEGFRPGVMERLGLGYDEISKTNEQIVYCSISGYGQTGMLAKVPGHDVNYLALSGALSISGDPEGPPAATGGVQIADLSSAMYAVISILAALRNRDKTGKGDYIDVSITDSVLAWMSPRIGQYYDKGRPTKKKLMGKGAYGTFETKDNQFIAIGSLEDHFFASLCEAINKPELLNEQNYQTIDLRAENAKELNTIIQQEISKNTLEYWQMIFDEKDIPSSKVINIDEVTNVKTFQEREVFEFYGHSDLGEYFIKYPVKFLNLSLRKNALAPNLGEHNIEIFKNEK